MTNLFIIFTDFCSIIWIQEYVSVKLNIFDALGWRCDFSLKIFDILRFYKQVMANFMVSYSI